MKIGILTYHRAENYGALLQAYAMMTYLRSLGHEVSFVDYWPKYHSDYFEVFSLKAFMHSSFKSKLLKLNRLLLMGHTLYKRKRTMQEFMFTQLELPKHPKYTDRNLVTEERYDAVIYGSDQIWRKQPEIKTYNPVYFGKHDIKTKKKITYAASMGVLPQKNSEYAILKDYMSHLDSISVREKSLQELVMNLGFEKVSHDLDPTHLLNQEYWVNKFKLVKNDKPYALYYKIQDSFDIQELRRYAKSKGLNLKVIHSRARCAESEENITTASPLQFLQLIYGASMVFTSSFHGLAFSLIFQKPFYASFTKNADRAMSLLKQCNLEDQFLMPQSTIPSKEKTIDYLNVDFTLDKLRSISIANLEESLSF